MLLLVFLTLLITLLTPSIFYLSWMKSKTKKSWGLKINSQYQPSVSLIIPTYNEAVVIGRKLESVQRMNYPEDKLEVILVDSASTDGTLAVCKSFLEKKECHFPTRLLSERQRMGKSHALNVALEYAKGEIIATSDADSFWEPDALLKAIPLFADSSVGAVTGREQLINPKHTIHTLSEELYREFYYALRLGESKVHSTLIFQGELSLYRKSVLKKFEDRAGCSDDTGTIINIISQGYRCIFVPEAVFHDTAAHSLRGKLMLKSRRGQHLVAGITKALKLKVQGKLPLSSPIILFNFHMHVISPLLLVTIGLLVLIYFQTFVYLMPLVIPLFIFKKTRLFVISYLTSNLALLMGLIRYFTGKKEVAWRKIDEMRAI